MSAMEPTPATPGTGDPNAATSPLEADFASAQEVQSLDSAAGAHAYGEIMQSPLADEASCRVKEQAIYALTHIYADEKAFDSILAVLSVANALFELIPKAKTAKIVRTILEIVSQVPDAIDLQVQLCNQIVEWCVSQKRSFLRQRVQTRLVVLLFKQHKYQDALSLCTSLLRELKKLDDKSMLVETHLAEAHVHHALRNLPKAKAASTAARSASNAIYVVPLLQAELDKMSGTLQCEEGDYTTSYSYFLEAFEAFNAQAEPANDRDAGPSGNSYRTAALCLKYMMLCQILAGTESDVHAIVAGKHGIRYAGPDLEAMLAIAAAAKDRSLKAFDAAIAKFGSVLSDDMLIKHHLAKLYDKLLESNLLRLIEPFSRCEVSHIAGLIDLPVTGVEKKLSQMILDNTLTGILDQAAGTLVVHENAVSDDTYTASLDVIANMSDVVQSLYTRSEKLVVS